MRTVVGRVLAVTVLTVGAGLPAAASAPVDRAEAVGLAPAVAAPADAVEVDELVLQVEDPEAGSVTGGPVVDPAVEDSVVVDRALASDRVASEVIDTTDRQTIGVTWPQSEPGAELDLRIRSKTDGTWSRWTVVPVSDLAPDAGTPDAVQAQTRAGTDSVWIGEADAVQLSVASSAVEIDDVRLAVIGSEPPSTAGVPASPGSSEPASPEPSASPEASAQPAVWVEGNLERSVAAPATAGAVPAAASVAPAVVTRAQWGATAPTCTMDSAPLVGAVLHHTAGSNTYATPAAAMQQIRNDQRYHMQSRGWCDLGYNFVVDKWGNIYEGRAGSLTSSVIGVHAGGFNTGTVGISMLGDYSWAPPPWAVTNSVARVIAWKLQAAGVDPAGTMSYWTGEGENSRYRNQWVTLPRVFGHRDTSYTACPGAGGYLILPLLRNLARGPFLDVAADAPFVADIQWLVAQGITTGHADGTFRPGDSVSRQAMAAFLYRAAGSPSFTAPAVSPFADVKTGDPFYKEISWLAAAGISTGTALGGGKFAFEPGGPVSRQAMAAFLYRAAGSPEFTASAVSPFVDVQPGDLFYEEISWLAASGISTGTALGGGKFAFEPGEPTSRQAMAAFLHRASTL